MKVKSEREVAQSCPTLSDPMDCSLPGSSIHGIFQARVLEWGAIAFSTSSPKVIHFSPQELINTETVRVYHIIPAFMELRISVTSPDPGLRMLRKQKKKKKKKG